MPEILMDLDGNILTSDQIKKMMETKQGCALIKEYTISALMAYTAQQMMNYLFELDKKATDLTFNEMQDLCNVGYFCLKKPDWKKIEAFLVDACRESKKIFDKEDYEKYMVC